MASATRPTSEFYKKSLKRTSPADKEYERRQKSSSSTTPSGKKKAKLLIPKHQYENDKENGEIMSKDTSTHSEEEDLNSTGNSRWAPFQNIILYYSI